MDVRSVKRSPLKAKRDTPRRNEGRVSHVRIKEPAARPPNALERKHQARLREMGCVISGSRIVHIHHIMKMDGKTMRRDHRYVVPLRPDLHNMTESSLHGLGSEEKFKEFYNFDVVAWAKEAWEATCAMENA